MEEVEEYDDDDEYGGEDEEVNEATDDGEVGSTTYSEFLEFEGQKFRYPSPIGPTWLGVTVVSQDSPYSFIAFNDSQLPFTSRSL